MLQHRDAVPNIDSRTIEEVSLEDAETAEVPKVGGVQLVAETDTPILEVDVGHRDDVAGGRAGRRVEVEPSGTNDVVGHAIARPQEVEHPSCAVAPLVSLFGSTRKRQSLSTIEPEPFGKRLRAVIQCPSSYDSQTIPRICQTPALIFPGSTVGSVSARLPPPHSFVLTAPCTIDTGTRSQRS